MDLLCDNILEEILRCLPAKYLHRVRAVSRRYNDIVRSTGFVARYWQSHSHYLSGVFLQTESLIRPLGHFPAFLAGSPRPAATESVFALDLGFLPHLPESRLQHETMGDARKIFIVHSTAGLLLCSKGRNNLVQYYVCNPVSWQCVSLPKLPWRSYHLYDLLSVTDNGDGIVGCFQGFTMSKIEQRFAWVLMASWQLQWRFRTIRVLGVGRSIALKGRHIAQWTTLVAAGTKTGLKMVSREKKMA